ncbi:PaaX family transcriptional regulator C-terminal domain-containing protein [Actinomycetospora straminea]|uniref:PaaX family transcriptional regulator C-terminal domain-containing protein n=1 Tax=Actinomycetospora straminea TaxID=663607 RepID=A0ABP9EIY8_9PSEU
MSGPEARVEAERAAVSARPQHLLLTLLGDHWYPERVDLPSTVLVSLLGEFGVAQANARAALSRLARRGLLLSRRDGRRTNYALTDEGIRTLDAGTERIFTFARGTSTWDGRWTLVTFSVPEEQRTVRSHLRSRLGWLGFAPLFDAVYAAPGDREHDAVAVLAELGVQKAAVVVGRASSAIAGGDPARAWDLEDLRRRYEEFAARFAPLGDLVDELTPAQALVARTAAIDVWREFPGLDPELPQELLPEHWPQARARELFAALYDGLAPAATERVRELVHEGAPDRAPLVSFHTTCDALDLVARDQQKL